MRRMIVTVVSLALSGAASAISWQGTSGGNWSDSTKWNGGTVPGAEDTANFESSLDSCSVRITNDVTVGTIQTSLNLPYPAPTMISDHRYDFLPFCIYGPTNKLTAGAITWTGGQASKPMFFDLKELCLYSAPVTPRGGQDVVFVNGLILTAAADLTYRYQKAASYADDKNNSLLHFGGETVFNAADGHNITFDKIVPYGEMTLKTRGTGVVSLQFEESATRLPATTLETGSTLLMRGRLNTDTLTLEAGSTLILTAGVAHVELGTSLAKADTAAIRVEVPSDLADGVYPVFTGAPGNDFVEAYKSLVTLAGDGASSVTLTTLNGSVAVLKGTLTAPTPSSNEFVWQGTEKTAQWTTSANWLKTSGDYPKASSAIPFLRGTETTTITNDNSSSLHHLVLMDTLGPLTLAGSATLNTQTWGQDAILCSNRFPTVFRVNVLQSNTGLFCKHLGGSYLELRGPSQATSKGFSFTGDFRIGCEFQTDGSGALANTSMLTLLEGGSLYAYQTKAWNFHLNVQKGATFMEGEKACARGAHQPNATSGTFIRFHRIDGHHSVQGTLSCGMMHYYGEGLLEVTKTGSNYSWGHCCLSGGLTLIPQAWYTEVENSYKGIQGLVAEGAATLGATNDWTYGVDPELETVTTKAADRALRVCEWATLTVDTENPDTGVGQTITLADPIFAYGKLIKKGEGTLLLATTNNVFCDTVTLRGGDIAWETNNAPTFAALAFDGGAIAPAVTDDGAYVPAVVTSDTDVSCLKVSFAGGEAPVEWKTVLKASGGARLTGQPWHRHCIARVVAGADGDEYQVCKARGFIFYVQ